MTLPRYYLSLQYSAIQKTVLRHDRLWYVAGISQGLAKLNEVGLPSIIENMYGGKILVAGGGKCTAVFMDKKKSENALAAIKKEIATTFPMLEFQLSVKPMEAADFQDAWKKGLIKDLNNQKKQFRGYGVSFNPHLSLCPECGEYPASTGTEAKGANKGTPLCAICHGAQTGAWSLAGTMSGSSVGATIEQIYTKFRGGRTDLKIPINFEDLSQWRRTKEEKKPRMVVWFSDLNNMNGKVPLWLRQEDEDIKNTFTKVKEDNITIVSESLKATFKNLVAGYLPFRLIVAGGDDLCIAMDEPFILSFCLNYAKTLEDKISKLEKDHPLNAEWLENKNKQLCEADEEWKKNHNPNDKPTPYCFGGSFVVTSTHTPFRRIHEVGEELMSEAKSETDRQGNSVNWVIMAVEKDALSEKLIPFEKPLLITGKYKGRLSFADYDDLLKTYRKKISGSQVQRIITAIIEEKGNNDAVEDWMIRQASRETDKLYSKLLTDNCFLENNKFQADRLATLLELMGIEYYEG